MQAEACAGLSPKHAADKDSHWKQWQAFVSTFHGVDPYLNCIRPHLHIPFLQVFAHRLRHGTLSTSRRPVQAKRVQAYLRTVAEEIRLGSQWRLDPRYGESATQHLDLAHLHRHYTKEDPPPDKVKPIPIQLLRHACADRSTPFARARSNMTMAGYFCVLRPGEHTYCRRNNHPFRIQHITFETARGPRNGATGPVKPIGTAPSVMLYFTDQKNGTKGQAIRVGDTSDPLLSPVKAVRDQVLMLRRHNAPPDTPLCAYYDRDGTQHLITSQDITNQLRASCKVIGKQLGLSPKDISARALRNGGCVALIRAGVDPLVAKMIGRWRSWAMIEYLQASSLDTTPHAQRMLDAGDFTIPQHQVLPTDVQALASLYSEE